MKKFFLLLLYTPFLLMGQGVTDAVGIGVLTVNTSYPIPLYAQESDSLPVDVITFSSPLRHKNIGNRFRYKSKLPLAPFFLWQGGKRPSQETRLSFGERLANFVTFFTGPFSASPPYSGEKIAGVHSEAMYRYPSLRFRVLEETPKSYKVITNETTKEAYYIQKDPQAKEFRYDKVIPNTDPFHNPILPLGDQDFWRDIASSPNPKWYAFETWEFFWLRAHYFSCVGDLPCYKSPNGTYEKTEACSYRSFEIIAVQGAWFQMVDVGGYEKTTWVRWFDHGKLQVVTNSNFLF